ncbi:hypothetical protein BDN72DRAFT_407518 [Pluteus cervinus]|uniref:Uncharacterized protein n=1 Tax=Pluteus cervinus TaxID=181527 RepID=A0ACD3B1P1_9AGAR|nr:hypothetical protein BDN72DRAFT_407518 [Pluteus cervinus]
MYIEAQKWDSHMTSNSTWTTLLDPEPQPSHRGNPHGGGVFYSSLLNRSRLLQRPSITSRFFVQTNTPCSSSDFSLSPPLIGPPRPRDRRTRSTLVNCEPLCARGPPNQANSFFPPRRQTPIGYPISHHHTHSTIPGMTSTTRAGWFRHPH